MKSRNATAAAAKSCTVEIGRSWDNYETYQACATFASVRDAKRHLAWAIWDRVDHLARCCYDVRLRMADGSIKTLTPWIQDDAIRAVKDDRWHNSIGARTRRGETVVC